jgi:predicted transcriptional regulator
MTTITIRLPDKDLRKLEEVAARFNVTPEELARLSIEELLSRPDEAFRQAVQYTLEKNSDLYRHLA